MLSTPICSVLSLSLWLKDYTHLSTSSLWQQIVSYKRIPLLQKMMLCAQNSIDSHPMLPFIIVSWEQYSEQFIKLQPYNISDMHFEGKRPNLINVNFTCNTVHVHLKEIILNYTQCYMSHIMELIVGFNLSSYSHCTSYKAIQYISNYIINKHYIIYWVKQLLLLSWKLLITGNNTIYIVLWLHY